ncbi:hypothetical protein B0I72DRAFT_163416 [Yarrowia lipolytica]|uniref:YALI0C15609p n=2 Tax=Yarrowia lipolytica TaxID=4952 RepID=Q6CBT6_YARLI|nr:YALI0C15609p [Yarrowia lipolytica CLIB122]RDW22675.1 hypothetical protein B0I71DRAFT_169642 [Yarrowia lipolytica]RDW29556.1 hypothetical protein B0I72DRAFT_163416 [Yarrowia lipolytica]RDW36129.1 hypothetical protein B0I73DRAFT_164349 [Yarrowia lipolytica]RDW43154.1 hypothetical protein B0I74DRAFT_162357 [Yarrowia lipolytica]RDW49919.1 hypothetical protein B0I75DRAFT_167879 [Yarrowia lipolytica]|eukprot:XP_501876.1 YALI0C15609p [Yarrowia lipolytica CLIB122]
MKLLTRPLRLLRSSREPIWMFLDPPEEFHDAYEVMEDYEEVVDGDNNNVEAGVEAETEGVHPVAIVDDEKKEKEKEVGIEDSWESIQVEAESDSEVEVEAESEEGEEEDEDKEDDDEEDAEEEDEKRVTPKRKQMSQQPQSLPNDHEKSKMKRQ